MDGSLVNFYIGSTQSSPQTVKFIWSEQQPADNTLINTVIPIIPT